MKSNVIRLYSHQSTNVADYKTAVPSPLDAEIRLDHLIGLVKHQLQEVKQASRYCQRLAEFKIREERMGLFNLSQEYQEIHARYKSQLRQLVECAL